MRGRGYIGPQLLLWVTLRFARGKIAVFGIPNNLNYCVILYAYTQLKNLAELCIIDGWSRGLDTLWVHTHGLDFTHAQRKCYFQD